MEPLSRKARVKQWKNNGKNAVSMCDHYGVEARKENNRKLDDGWPESVEEQSLLLLVWRHYTTR